MTALDYSKLAAVYDDYCVFVGDIAFFRNWAHATSGEILELMAGTGRISLPLIQDGARLTCVDSSLAMLAVLQRKLREAGLDARLICADVCQLPLRRRFSLVLLPFQGLTELLTSEAQLDALRAAASVLSDSGRFICTSHNPTVRLRSVDDTWHEVGTFSRSDGGTLTVSLRCRYDETSDNVVGQQRLLVTAPSGEASEMILGLRFRLVSLPELTALVERAGLRIAEVLGDYGGGHYDPASSPVLIAVLEETGYPSGRV
jgi:ubiquinone/menaquinone biosynthesis C-methylase UbiE